MSFMQMGLKMGLVSQDPVVFFWGTSELSPQPFSNWFYVPMEISIYFH